MKQIKCILFMALAVFYFTALNAQSTSTKSKTSKTIADTVYRCPMKCEGDKTYVKPGKCPVCNMNLKASVTSVDTDQYQCPMKCERDKTYDKGGKCPTCNMDLKKVMAIKPNEGPNGHNHN